MLMRKFSKILFLLLALVTIVTSISLVALAADKEESAPITAEIKKFEDYAVNDVVKDVENKEGKWTIAASDNGSNKYVVGEYAEATGTADDNWDITVTGEKKGTEDYDVLDYPTFAFDFDVMSNTGSYHYSTTIRPDLYGGESQANRITTMSGTALKDIALPKEAYVWNHVTFIVRYDGNGIFSFYFYVNGKQTLTKTVNYYDTAFKSSAVTTVTYWNDLTDENGNLKYDNVRVAIISMLPVTDSTAAEKVCYDNFAYTYYPASYDVESVASYVYNEDYEMPYGKTVATVTDSNGTVLGMYDSVQKAIDAALENSTVDLLYDTTATYEIHKKLTVNTNGYAFAYTSKDYLNESTEDGVYKFIPISEKYDGAYIDKDGNLEYFNGYLGFEEAVDAVISSASSGTKSKVRKIILYNDIEYYKSFKFLRYTNLSIDLNGKTLTRVYLYGDVYSRENSEAEYTTGDAVAREDAAHNAFILNFDVTFSMNSSKEGGVFRTVAADSSAYYTNGKLDSYTVDSLTGAGFLRQNANHSRITLDLENISIFAENILNQSASVGENIVLNVTKCNFYKTVGETDTSAEAGYGCIRFAAKGPVTVTLTDSLFYFPDSSVIGESNVEFLSFSRKNSDTLGFNATITNCDIISENESVSVTKNSYNADTNIIFDNCRIYNIKKSTVSESPYSPVFKNGTLSTDTIANGSTVFEGCVWVSESSTLPYYLPSNSKVTIASGKPVFEFDFESRNVTFTKEVKLYREVYATVSWLDENGELIKTTEALKNSTVTAPEYFASLGDGYRGFKVTKWFDESGNASDLAILDADTYSFKANPVFDENAEYAAKITEAQFNFVFYGNFTTILYLPCLDEMNAPTVSGFIKGDKNVRIDGVEFWAYYKENTVTDVSDDTNAVVDFTIDGQDFSQTLTLNALIYAEVILTYPENDIESRAVANMIRYIKEARIAAELEISEEFAEVEARYAIDGYEDTYSDLGADMSDLNGYVESVRFMLHGSYASYVITLTQTAVNNGATLNVEFADTEKEISVFESTILANSYYTVDTRVYDLTGLIKISVTVTEEGTPKTVSGTYSIGAYINSETDCTLAKAIYEFGMAASTYREYLTAKYDPKSPDVKLYEATFMADGVFVGTDSFHMCTEKLNEPEVPQKNGYTGAWEKYYITNSDMTVNAVYTPITYTITYNTNNPYATHSNPQSYTAETESFNITAPVSEGDEFLGWYLDAEFNTPAPDSIIKGSFGDITLYGNWDCIHEVTVIERQDATPLKDGYEVTNCSKCTSHELTEVLPATKSIKILSIGNSYNVDVFTYFGSILNAEGVENITLGILYHGGYGIGNHWDAMNNESKVYDLYLSNSNYGITAQPEKVTLEYGIKLEDWDIITMHQSVKDYGDIELTSDKLSDLVNYVKAINSDAKLYTQIPWSYSTDYLLANPDKAYGYESNSEMYNAALSVAQEVFGTNDNFTKIMPAGTAIQNIRTSYLGDNITRDGVHLNTLGRYAASLTWFASICGFDNVDDVTYKLSSISEYDFEVIKEAVNNALENPYNVTASTYTTASTAE